MMDTSEYRVMLRKLEAIIPTCKKMSRQSWNNLLFVSALMTILSSLLNMMHAIPDWILYFFIVVNLVVLAINLVKILRKDPW